MSTAKKTSMVAKPAKTIEQKIADIAERMRRSVPTELTLPTGVGYDLTDDDRLKRFEDGDQLTADDWYLLGTLLIRKLDPSYKFSVSDDCDGEPVIQFEANQKIIRIYYAWNAIEELNSWSWYLQMFEGASPKVKTFAVRQLYSNLHTDVIKTGGRAGFQVWKLSVESHIETPYKNPDEKPFEDAILFDMLLDLATDNFKPHTRTIEDGPTIMLEILQALEEVQKEVEAAASSNPKKRRLTVKERLDAKRVKQ